MNPEEAFRTASGNAACLIAEMVPTYLLVNKKEDIIPSEKDAKYRKDNAKVVEKLVTIRG